MRKIESKVVRRNSKRRKNGVINIIVLTIIIIALFAIFGNVNANKYYETKKIVVCENDTLWSIATSICKKNPGLDTYKVIKDIKSINELKSSTIYEGQVLNIYIYD